MQDVSDEREVSDLRSNEEKDWGREQARGLRNLKSFNSPFSAAFFSGMIDVCYGAYEMMSVDLILSVLTEERLVGLWYVMTKNDLKNTVIMWII